MEGFDTDIDLEQETFGEFQGWGTESTGGFGEFQGWDNPTPETEGAVEAPQSDPDSFSSSIGRGVQGIISSSGGAAETAGELVDSADLIKWGQEVRQNALEEMQAFGKSSAPSFIRAETPAEFLQFTQEAIGNVIPSMGVTATGASIGGTLGGGRGAALGVLISSGLLGMGETQNLLKQLAPDSENPLAAVLGGAVTGALDLAGLRGVAAPLIKRLGIDTVEQTVVDGLLKKGFSQKVAEDTTKAFLIEATTEAAQDVAKSAIAHNATYTEMDFDQEVESAINSFMAGGIGGAVIGGPLAVRGAAFDTTLKEPTEAIEEVSEEAPSDLKRIFKAVASRPTDILEHYKYKSRSMATILDDLRVDERSKGKIAQNTVKDLEEDYKSIASYIDESSRGLTDKEIVKLGLDYAKGERSHPFQQSMALVGDFLGIKSKALFGTELRENWIYSMLDPKKILKNKTEFEEQFSPYLSTDPKIRRANFDNFYKELESEGDSVTALVDNQQIFNDPEAYQSFLENTDGFKYQKIADNLKNRQSVRTNASMEAQRYFPQVPQAVVEGWVAGNPKERMIAAIQKGSRRLAYAEKFGAHNESLNARILGAIKETAEQGDPISHRDIKYLYSILDAYQGIHSPVTNKVWRQTQATLNTIGTLSMLPLSTLSSFVEMFNVAVKFDTGTMLASIMPAIRTAARQMVERYFKSVPLSDMSKQMQQANITYSASQHIIAQRMTDVATTKWQASVNNMFFKINMLSYWTHFMRIWAAHASKIQIKDDLTILGNDPRPNTVRKKAALERLYHVGVDPVKYRNAELDERGHIEARAVRRLVHDIVLEPHSLARPVWMSNGNLAVLAQLKGYPTMFTNTILPVLLQKMQPSRAGGYNAVMGMVDVAFIVGGLMLVGSFQEELKRAIKGKTADDRSDTQYMLDVLEKTLMPIHLGYMTSMWKASTYRADPTSTLLGPTASLVNDTVKTMSEVAEQGGSEKLTEWFLRRTPLAPWAGVLTE